MNNHFSNFQQSQPHYNLILTDVSQGGRSYLAFPFGWSRADTRRRACGRSLAYGRHASGLAYGRHASDASGPHYGGCSYPSTLPGPFPSTGSGGASGQAFEGGDQRYTGLP